MHSPFSWRRVLHYRSISRIVSLSDVHKAFTQHGEDSALEIWIGGWWRREQLLPLRSTVSSWVRIPYMVIHTLSYQCVNVILSLLVAFCADCVSVEALGWLILDLGGLCRWRSLLRSWFCVSASHRLSFSPLCWAVKGLLCGPSLGYAAGSSDVAQFVIIVLYIYTTKPLYQLCL